MYKNISPWRVSIIEGWYNPFEILWCTWGCSSWMWTGIWDDVTQRISDVISDSGSHPTTAPQVHHRISKGLYVISKVWEAQEVIYDAHTKHGSHLKLDSTYTEVLKSGFKWENIQVDISHFYFKCKIWEARIS